MKQKQLHNAIPIIITTTGTILPSSTAFPLIEDPQLVLETLLLLKPPGSQTNMYVHIFKIPRSSKLYYL